jgi:hypothetical protein
MLQERFECGVLSEKIMKLLREIVRDSSLKYEEREKAIRALGEMYTPEAAELLFAMADNESNLSPELRAKALHQARETQQVLELASTLSGFAAQPEVNQ